MLITFRRAQPLTQSTAAKRILKTSSYGSPKASTLRVRGQGKLGFKSGVDSLASSSSGNRLGMMTGRRAKKYQILQKLREAKSFANSIR